MPMRSHTLIALLAGAAIGFSGAVATNVLAQRTADAPGAHGDGAASLPWEDAHLFAEVFDRIKRDYVDPEGDHKLVENAIRGMVSGLDPHSAYLDSEEFDEIRLSTMGTYPGVGIEVAAEGSSVKILHSIAGSPAELAGIRAGDLIAKIDGVEVKKRRVAVDVFAPNGRPAGATARVALVFRTTGHTEKRVAVRARLFLTRGGHGHWRIFGYDVARGVR